MKDFRVLSLFAGIGGFDLGLERTGGFRTVRFYETEPFCQEVLRKHWPDARCCGDVMIGLFDRGEADVICGGFPCQDISNAGKRAGITGARSRLWWGMLRAIRMVRPRYAVVENVAALLTRGMGTVLGDLAEIGYDTEWNCIPASAVGLAHRRDRVWIVAYPDRQGLARTRQSGAPVEQRSPFVAGFLAASGFSGPGAAPEMVRNVHGIPDRTHRITALGNAVVPQIPELIGRAILAAEGAR